MTGLALELYFSNRTARRASSNVDLPSSLRPTTTLRPSPTPSSRVGDVNFLNWLTASERIFIVRPPAASCARHRDVGALRRRYRLPRRRRRPVAAGGRRPLRTKPPRSIRSRSSAVGFENRRRSFTRRWQSAADTPSAIRSWKYRRSSRDTAPSRSRSTRTRSGSPAVLRSLLARWSMSSRTADPFRKPDPAVMSRRDGGHGGNGVRPVELDEQTPDRRRSRRRRRFPACRCTGTSR